MYLLDTNICIYAIKGCYPQVNEKLLSISPDQILVSSITLGELEYGAAKSHWGNRTRLIMNGFLSNFEILPFTANDAALFGQIRAELESSGSPIGALDAMIGAQGIANNLTVITHNTKEFSRIPGIQLEDWVS